jgi:hypothetical protein
VTKPALEEMLYMIALFCSDIESSQVLEWWRSFIDCAGGVIGVSLGK